MERQQTPSLLTNTATQAAKVQPQLKAAQRNATEQKNRPLATNTQSQLSGSLKPMEQMTVEEMMLELRLSRAGKNAVASMVNEVKAN